MNSNTTNLPKYYANVISEKPEDYSNYENLEMEWGYILS